MKLYFKHKLWIELSNFSSKNYLINDLINTYRLLIESKHRFYSQIYEKDIFTNYLAKYENAYYLYVLDAHISKPFKNKKFILSHTNSRSSFTKSHLLTNIYNDVKII